MPGVQHVAAISLTAGVLADGTQVRRGVAPRQYAALIAATPGPRFPAAALARHPGPTARPQPSPPGRRPPSLARGTATLVVGSAGTIERFRVVAAAPAAPALAGRAGSTLIVVPDWALRAGAQPPNLMLITGPHLDQGRLRAVAARLVPGGSVTFRSAALAGLAGAPLPHGVYVAYAAGAPSRPASGSRCCWSGCWSAPGSRDAALARLAAMGLSARQGSWLALAETLPEIVVAIAAGTACAWALASLVGPDLSLAAFTGSGAGVQVRAGTKPAADGRGGRGPAGRRVRAMASQAIVDPRRGVARTLRIGVTYAGRSGSRSREARAETDGHSSGTGRDRVAAAVGNRGAGRRGAGRARTSYGEDALIVCDRLVRIYTGDGVEVQALQGLDLLVERGRAGGASSARPGSGKSTLLNILSGLDMPTAGPRRVAGHDLLRDDGRATGCATGAQVVGFIWQQTGAQPAAVPDRRGERRAADAASPASPRASARAPAPASCSELLGVGVLRRPPARPDVRRRAAAGRDRGRPGQRARRCCSPTSRPASWTRATAARGVRRAAHASTPSSA